MMKSWGMRWAGYVAQMGKMRNVYKIYVGKPERKKPIRRPRHRWEDNIKWVLRKEGGREWPGFIWLNIQTGGRLL
jgi:hypothetical protein